MEETALLAPLLLTIAGLTVGAIFKSLFQRTRIPYTVGLFAIGLAAGIMNRTGVFHNMPQFSSALDSVANINPDLILYIFLPILIFDAAYELNLHIFKKTLTNATLLAAPGLIICMILTAIVLMVISIFVPGYEKWTWASALMFGALISATDPVAVVALLHELKTSKRFSTLVDAESLLNDGTGIVCFMLFYGVTVWGRSDDLTPVLEFCQVVAGGAILGYIAARLVIWFITRVNSEEMIQNSVIILSAYLVFILAQLYLGISGVIALVAFGLTIAYIGKLHTVTYEKYMSGIFKNCSINLYQYFKEKFEVDVILQNDLHFAILAEQKYGILTGKELSCCYLQIGRGCAASYLIDNKLYVGATGLAGEIGHNCVLGSNKVVENFVDWISVQAKIQEKTGKQLQLETAVGYYNSGDSAVCSVVDEAAQYAGVIIKNLTELMDFDIIILSGPMTEFGARYMENLKKSFYQLR